MSCCVRHRSVPSDTTAGPDPLRLQHHLRWDAAGVETRDTVPVGQVQIILVPLTGRREGRVALVVVESMLQDAEAKR